MKKRQYERFQQLIERFFERAIRLYPASRRSEFAQEMRAVFHLRVQDATRSGWAALIRLFIKEARDLPGAIGRAYISEMEYYRRDYMNGGINGFKKASMPQALGSTIPFILIGLLFGLPLLFHLADNTTYLIWAFFLLALAGSYLIYLVFNGGIRRWALPLAGLLLTPFGLYLGGAISYLIERRRLIAACLMELSDLPGCYQVYKDFPLDYMFVRIELMWFSLLGIALLILLISILLNLQGLYRPFIKDWSLLSFLIYGSAGIVLWLTFEDYPIEGLLLNRGLYIVLASLVLAGGAIGYMRNEGQRWRSLPLLVGVLIAMGVAALGKYIIIAGGASFGDVGSLPVDVWKGEALGTLVMTVWLLVALIAPWIIQWIIVRVIPPPNTDEILAV